MRTKLTWIVTVLVAAALLTGCAGRAFAQTETPPTPGATPVNRTLTVNGSGRVYMVPDIAYITIGVHTEGESASEAVQENSTQAQAVVDALRGEGIAEADIQTNNFSIYPQQQFDDQGRPTGEVRFSVDNSVYVTIRNIENVGDILDTAVSAGANSINGIQFDVENKTEFLADAREAAVADARAKAQDLAEAAELTLGEIQSISEYTSGGPTPMFDMRAGAEMAQAAASIPVNPGQILLTLEVNVVFGIE
jgi:uncharacterized protein YggE